MPQFELVPAGHPPAFVRARSPEDAVRRHLGGAVGPAGLALGDAEAGTGWQEVSLDGEPWGRLRTRDRMRFRRD